MATIYKEGCTDKEMTKRIQKVVGARADGVWGPMTTAAVKAWQKNHALTADGIVGPATLAKMGLSPEEQSPDDIKIKKAFINSHITFCIGRPLKYIAIHYTAGGSSKAGTAMQNRNVFLQRAASADFVVDDEQIVQVNPDIRNYYCWAVGDKKNNTTGARLNCWATNKSTISIEICSNLKKGTSATIPNHEGWSFTEASLENARRLVRYLMKTYGIQKENVIRHYDATGKLCPGIPGWNDGLLYGTDGKITAVKNNSKKWEAFLASI